jgi:hypothetical protein
MAADEYFLSSSPYTTSNNTRERRIPMPHFLELIRHEVTKVTEELIPLQNRVEVLSKKKNVLDTFLQQASELYPDNTELKKASLHAQYVEGVSLNDKTVVRRLPRTDKRKPLHAPGTLASAIEFIYTMRNTDVLSINDIAEELTSGGHYADRATAKRNLGVFFSRSDKYTRVAPGTYRKRIGDTTIGEILSSKGKEVKTL